MKLFTLNEAVLQSGTIVTKLLPHLKLDTFEYDSYDGKSLYFEFNGKDFIPCKKSDKNKNFIVNIEVKDITISDTPKLLSGSLAQRRASTGSERLDISLSHIPSSEGFKSLKKDLKSVLIHELTHLKQYSLEIKHGPELTADLRVKRANKELKKKDKEIKKYGNLQNFNLLVKKYFSDKNELMAYANQFSEELDLDDFKKLSKEIKYDSDITSFQDIAIKYNNHKWFTPETKILFIFFTVYKRTDKTYKRLVKYFVEYLQQKEEKEDN